MNDGCREQKEAKGEENIAGAKRVYHNLNSLKGGYIGDYIGNYYRGY